MRVRTLLLTLMIAGLLFSGQSAISQPLLVENFEYTEGTTLVSNGWTAHSGAGTNSPAVVSPGLTYPNYMGTGIGLAASMVKTGEDLTKVIEGQSTGSVYAAFMVKISDAGTGDAGDYFFHFITEGSTTFRGRVFVKKHATEPKLAFGISKGANGASATWTGFNYDLNTVYLLALKYEFISGDTNDACSLFINPVPGEAEPTATVVSGTETTSDFTNLNAIALRQGNSIEGSVLVIDGIRVATTWAEAVKLAGSVEDTQAPVASFEPANGTTNVALSIVPTITFNEPIFKTDGTEMMDADLASLVSFKDGDENDVEFDATINFSKTVITINPTITLTQNTFYTISIGAVEDETGNESLTQATSFTTLSTNPEIAITSPANNAVIMGGDVTIELSVSNFTVGNPGTGADGHIHYTVDGGSVVMKYDTNPIVLTGLSMGSHAVIVELVDNDHLSFDPQITATVNFTTTETSEGELFISEYIEGSSSNKAIEIFNPNPFPVDLTGYSLKLFSNGSTEPTNPVDLTGTIAANGVYIVANASAVAEILNIANTTSTVTFFNGDDAVGLFKNNVLIDVFGLIGTDPGTAWDVAGVVGATLDHTLVRKSHISQGNLDWAQQAGTNADNSEWIVYPNNTFSYLGSHQFGLNTETDILSFSLPQQTGNATINPTAHTVSIEVIYGTDVTALVPVFTLSGGATANVGGVAQTSGETVVNFASPVTYTVVAQNGTITQDWTVTVTVSSSQSTEAEILTFTIPNQVGNSVISSSEGTVQITVQPGADVTALVPTITVSNGATINPESGVAQNFTTPVTYTVTAQDGTTTKQWIVSVVFQSLTTIYDIQYTTATNGNSPLLNQIVTTSGIVTAIHGTAGFYIQDGTGLWNGIYVYKGTQAITLPAVGDEIILRAKVVEYYNLTEMKDIELITVVSSGNELPAPLAIVAADVTEGTEGILVRAEYFTCVHDGSGNYWTSKYVHADAPTDTLLVFRQMYPNFLPFVGKRYHFTGVIAFDFGAFKIAPRGASDVTELDENLAPAITDIAIYPETPVTGSVTYVQSTITDDGGPENITKHFFYGFDEEEITNELPLTPIGVQGTRFLVTIPAQSAATPVYFRIVANDGDLETEYVGSFDIIAGIEEGLVSELSLFPNPASDKLFVNVNASATYSVSNIAGQKLMEGLFVSGQNEVNLTNLNDGFYIITIVTGNGTVNASTFIKK